MKLRRTADGRISPKFMKLSCRYEHIPYASPRQFTSMKPTFPQTALNEDSTNIQFIIIGLSYHPHPRPAVFPMVKTTSIYLTH